MVKIVLMILFSLNVFSYIPEKSLSFTKNVSKNHNDSYALILNEYINQNQSRVLLDDFLNVLYFRTDEEKKSFGNNFSLYLSKLFQSKYSISKGTLIDEYYLMDLELNLLASDVLSVYNSLKECQISNLIPVDPLSTTLSGIVTGSYSPATLKSFRVEGIFKYLVYAHYQKYLLKEAYKIYIARLDSCNHFSGGVIAGELDKIEFQINSEIQLEINSVYQN
jgi:hypothetical protein